MTAKIELVTLLDRALGQPEMGAVNFKILHGFLKNLLGHLSLSSVEVDFSDEKEEPNDENLSVEHNILRESPENKKSEVLGQYSGAVEKRVRGLEDRLHLLDSFSASEDILKWAKQREDSHSKIGDIWNFMNMQKRIEATESGIKKISSVVDKILSQLKNVSDLQERMYNMEKKMDEFGDLKNQLNLLSEKMKGLDDAQKMEDLMQQIGNLKNAIASMALKEDLDICVQWPQLQSALESRKVSPTSNGEKSKSGCHQGGKSLPSVQSIDKLDSSGHPTKEVVDTLGELGGIILAHRQLAEEVETLKHMLNKKANLEDLENLSSGEIPEDLIEQLAQLNGDVGELKLWKEDVEEDREKIQTMTQTLSGLESAIERLQNSMKHVVEEHSRKQKHIDALYSLSSKLEENKMNKEDYHSELSKKADKSELENFVSRQRFDTNIGRIDDLLKELVDKFRSSDETLNKMIAKIIQDLEGKVDRDELQDLKDYLESRLKALKAKQREEQTMDEDTGAIFKKAMLQFNCLSCDRPVYFSPNGPMQSFSGLPSQKSGRPYTTYELDQMRMLQKGSLKPEMNDYSTYRSCGGSHTSSSPIRRISAKLNSFVSSYDEVPVPPPTVRSEVDIQGQDGKLYRGRVDKNEEFPDVNRRQLQNGRVKPKSAHAGLRTGNSPNPGEGAFIPRRPKTAINRSQTPDHADRPQTARLRTPSPDFPTVGPCTEDQYIDTTAVEDFA